MNSKEPVMENQSVVNYQIAENTYSTHYCAGTGDSYTDIIGLFTPSTRATV